MQFDLRSFLESAKNPYTAKFLLEPSYMDFGSFQLSEPAVCEFFADPVLEGAAARLHITARIQGECARCLDPVTGAYDFEREYLIRLRDLEDEYRELPIDEKGHLLLEELAFQELLYEVPPVLLCSADCQGLCPTCGKKKTLCICPKADAAAPVDARLSILKQLLS